MRTKFQIIVLVSVLLACVGCSSHRGLRADDEAVARVGSAYFYRSELAALMPEGVAAADSVNCSNAIISKWMVAQLKQKEAEMLFESSSRDIEKLVEEYRRSLLVQRLDRHYLEKEPCGEISEQKVAEYYNAHKADFKVKQPMVKGEIVALGENNRRRKQLAEWFSSATGEKRVDFEEICRKEKISHLKFSEWVLFSDYLSNLPLLRNANHDGMLGNRSIQQIHHNKVYYYYRITAVLNVGDTMPLELAAGNIREILTKSHNAEVLRRHEEKMEKSALSSGNAEIFN